MKRSMVEPYDDPDESDHLALRELDRDYELWLAALEKTLPPREEPEPVEQLADAANAVCVPF